MPDTPNLTWHRVAHVDDLVSFKTDMCQLTGVAYDGVSVD